MELPYKSHHLKTVFLKLLHLITNFFGFISTGKLTSQAILTSSKQVENMTRHLGKLVSVSFQEEARSDGEKSLL